ncbi:unnamed protein product [Cyclocybe aegerita]|uniref:Cytochrome P450 n=1 Tax=Cyclocybe aegerita TaxID=1973307 RepID=A0A8S0VQT8_CYCAE|nr:unnamed protein product [Cyclocybe aegerita]
MSVTYGIDVLPKNDPYIETAEKSLRAVLDAAVPGAFLVDSLPWLKYLPEFLPGAGFKRKAREWHKLARMMVENPYEAAMRNMDAGVGRSEPSFLTIGLEAMRANEKGGAITENVIQDSAGAIYAAGSDTTVATIASCILGLLSRPDVLEKAQTEIDSVIKPGHLPEFEDEPSLPYVTAIVKESLRWFAVAPTAIPHLLEVEDEYKGYRLPAGSIVMGNSWAMLNDEKVYPDPSTFNPDRFMKGGKLNPDIRDPAHACWGFGRRVCPGRYLAFSSVWINVASMIAAFDIKKATDTYGNVIEPNTEFVSGLVCGWRPFQCSITPRSREMELLIRSNAAREDF